MRQRRTVGRLLLTGVLALVLSLLALWLGQRRLIYFPDPSAPSPAASVLPGARDVEFTTSDGLRLAAWHVEPAGPARGYTVLVTPGNGGNRLGRAPLAAALARAGFAVLLMEYRGYGGNPGAPTERGLARDARAARQYLVDGAGVPANRIVYFGESLGAAAATALASDHPPAGLLLRSPFESLTAAARYHYPALPVRALLRDRFPVADLMSRITVPTVVVYGTADSVVPAGQSLAVARRAGGPVEVVVIEGADHNDPDLVHGSAVVGAVAALADRVSSG